MLLSDNQRFRDDIKRYTEAINNLQDQQQKSQATRLLNDLIQAVKQMDNRYLDMVYARQLPSMGNEMRDSITHIRKQLENTLRL
jgi:septal ring factor EnvC (AmiA/AmiB activator)